MSIVGGVLGAGLARLIVNAGLLGMAGGFIPVVRREHRERRRSALGLSALIGVLAGADSGDDGVAAQDRRRAAAGGV